MKRSFVFFLTICLCLLPLAGISAQENVQALVERGKELSNNGKFDEAIATFNRALQAQPHNPALYVYRARAKYAKNLNNEAIADLDQALKVDPNFAQAYNTRAQVHFSMEDFQQALEDLQEAKKLGFKVDADYMKLVQKQIREKQK
jgi:tetratricopeptide (TPR) repeat protein